MVNEQQTGPETPIPAAGLQRYADDLLIEVSDSLNHYPGTPVIQRAIAQKVVDVVRGQMGLRSLPVEIAPDRQDYSQSATMTRKTADSQRGITVLRTAPLVHLVDNVVMMSLAEKSYPHLFPDGDVQHHPEHVDHGEWVQARQDIWKASQIYIDRFESRRHQVADKAWEAAHPKPVTEDLGVQR